MPPKFVRDNEDKLIPNQEHLSHQRQDNLVSFWLIFSVGPSLMPQLIGCKTSHEAWTAMKRVFTSQSDENQEPMQSTRMCLS